MQQQVQNLFSLVRRFKLHHAGSIVCVMLGWCWLTQAGAQLSQPAAQPAASALRVAVQGNIFSRLEKSMPTGVLVEATDAILTGMGKSPSYINMPVGEALKDLKAGTVAVVAGVVQTPALKDSAYFSDPILNEFNIAVTLKSKSFELTGIADLQGKKVGARIGYHYPMLENNSNIELLRFATDGEMLRALLFGSIDLAIIAGISDIYTFRSEGIMKKLEVLKTALGKVPLVVAFSKIHFSQQDVAAFNQGLAGLKASQNWESILEKNGLADLVKDWPLLAQ